MFGIRHRSNNYALKFISSREMQHQKQHLLARACGSKY